VFSKASRCCCISWMDSSYDSSTKGTTTLPADIWSSIQAQASTATLKRLCCVSKFLNTQIWNLKQALSLWWPIQNPKLVEYVTRSPKLESLEIHDFDRANFKLETLETLIHLLPRLTSLGVHGYALPYMWGVRAFSWHDSLQPPYPLKKIGQFTNLHRLHLPCAKLLEVLQDLPFLTELTIQDSLYRPDAPDLSVLSRFTNLNSLHLQDIRNDDCETIPSCLTQLTSITFGYTEVSWCRIPLQNLEHFSAFPNLTYLDLTNRRYEGQIKELVKLCPNLHTLILPRVQRGVLHMAYEILHLPPALRVLHVGLNMAQLGYLTQLQHLKCSHDHRLYSSDPISSLTNLLSLEIYGRPGQAGEVVVIQHEGDVRPIQHLTKLRTLGIPHCHLEHGGFDFLTTLTNLTELNLSQSPKLDDYGIQRFQFLTNLEKLNLQECAPITGKGFKTLVGLTNLTDLNLRGTNFGGRFIQSLTKMPIRHLDLSETPMTDQGLAHLKNFKNLETIGIFNCPKVSRRGPVGARDMVHVKWEVKDWTPQKPN
jgi:hypothetical protein